MILMSCKNIFVYVSFGFKGCHDAFHPTSSETDCGHYIFPTILLPPATHHCTGLPSGILAMFSLVRFNWVSPWSISRKTGGWCIQKPPDQMKKLCISLVGCHWARMGTAWLTSQSHGGELESGEPACLPLLSQRALFVARHLRLSHRGEPGPHISPLMHLSTLAIAAQPSLTYSTPQRGNMSSLSPHIVLKRPRSPRGPLLFLCRSICWALASIIHLSIRLPVFKRCHLSPAFTIHVCTLTEDISIAFVSDQ